MDTKLQELKTRLSEIGHLNSAIRLLLWDRSVYMPLGGAAARGRQTATLERLRQEKFTDPAIGKLLDALQPYEESLPYDSDEASLIRVTRREYEKQLRVPAAFTAQRANHLSQSYQAWTQARPANDFVAMRPYLEKTLELSRQYAEFFPGYNHLADPLLDMYDPGLTVAEVRTILSQLRAQLVPLVQAITAQPEPDDSCLHQPFPGEQQITFALEIAKQFGYDFERGRQDKTLHPFAVPISLDDVRITTRANDYHLGDGLFATLHEAGHGLHLQGFRSDLDLTLLSGISMSVAESQSRLWENIVSRSRGLWEYYYPKLQAIFPDQLGQTPLEIFYRAINSVKPSLIRVQADELTYNLHIMIRFELELELLEGRLAVRDLPEAWRERYQTDLGIVPPDDKDGVLQDAHWYQRLLGYFPSYTLGNILATQFFDAAVQAQPEIPSEIEQGHFRTLHGWLKDNIYQHGIKYTGSELTERLTGGPISIEPCLRYWRTKFGALYDLEDLP